MRYVIDASVGLKWVLDEPGQQAADALLTEELLAPALWLLEAANALWRRAQRAEITVAEAEERLAELYKAPVVTVPIEADLPRALQLAAELGHPVYDCLYLALALREHAQLVTADQRLARAVSSHASFADVVRLLGSAGG